MWLLVPHAFHLPLSGKRSCPELSFVAALRLWNAKCGFCTNCQVSLLVFIDVECSQEDLTCPHALYYHHLAREQNAALKEKPKQKPPKNSNDLKITCFSVYLLFISLIFRNYSLLNGGNRTLNKSGLLHLCPRYLWTQHLQILPGQ